MSRAAFAAEADSFSTLGHEITHYQHYLTPGLYEAFKGGDDMNYFTWQGMSERAAYEWTYRSAVENGWRGWKSLAEDLLRFEYGYEVPQDFMSRVNLRFVR